MSQIISRRDVLRVLGTGIALLGSGAPNAITDPDHNSKVSVSTSATSAASTPSARDVVADPILIPPPIKRNHPVHHEITF